MTRGLDLPRVLTIHGFIHEDTRLKGGWKNRLRSALWKREELKTWSEQPHIIAISPYVRERLRGIATGVIHDIENPINSACFDIVRSEQAGRIFSAAIICRRKNPMVLVEALSLLRGESDAKLVLAGPISESGYGVKVERSIRDHGMTECVEMPGSLSGAAVKDELGKAAVFALCSFEEGAPMAIAEAMAAGVPIITSNRCGMPYMVRDCETGFLVDPHQATEIAARIDDLLKNPELRRNMGQAARDFAEKRFHPDRVAERTLRVYLRAINHPQQTSHC